MRRVRIFSKISQRAVISLQRSHFSAKNVPSDENGPCSSANKVPSDENNMVREYKNAEKKLEKCQDDILGGKIAAALLGVGGLFVAPLSLGVIVTLTGAAMAMSVNEESKELPTKGDLQEFVKGRVTEEEFKQIKKSKAEVFYEKHKDYD